jgi:hypothetical protein
VRGDAEAGGQVNPLLRALSSPLRNAYWSWKLEKLSREQTRVRREDLAQAPAGSLRVGWVLAGNEWLGSARVKGFHIDRHFRGNECGVFSRLLYYPGEGTHLHNSLDWRRGSWLPLLDHIDVLSFQTRTGATIELLRECRRRGIATVFSLSDLSMSKVPPEVFELSDAVVVSSEFLAENVRPLARRVVVIDDPIEVPETMRREDHGRGAKPEVVWLGHPDHWGHVAFLREVMDTPAFQGVTLRTISRHPEATHQWDPISVWEHCRHSDIAAIPTDLDVQGKARSSNRLTAFMELAYPVIAGPIPAYLPHVRHGENGFFATSVEEWRACLTELLDPARRNEMGNQAKGTESLVALRLSSITNQWKTLFEEVRAK